MFLARKRAASLSAATHKKKRVTIFAASLRRTWKLDSKCCFVAELQRQPNKQIKKMQNGSGGRNYLVWALLPKRLFQAASQPLGGF